LSLVESALSGSEWSAIKHTSGEICSHLNYVQALSFNLEKEFNPADNYNLIPLIKYFCQEIQYLFCNLINILFTQVAE